MPLRRLQVTDFRCLQSVSFDLAEFTLISGANATGKTTLLEAMYVLGRGRSFRTQHIDHLIRYGRERFVIFGEIDAFDRIVPLGIEGAATGIRARAGGATCPSARSRSRDRGRGHSRRRRAGVRWSRAGFWRASALIGSHMQALRLCGAPTLSLPTRGSGRKPRNIELRG